MNLNVSGIYCIVNIRIGKIYLGSAVNIRKRWSEHRRTLRLGKHHSRLLQRAWDKYGEEAFKFFMLERVESRSELVACEQIWIDRIRPFDPTRGYNINPKAESRLGASWTKERRIDFSLQRKGFGKGKKLSTEHKEALLAGRRSFVFTEETKKKISEANRGRKLPPVAESTRLKLSLAAKADWQRRKANISEGVSHG